MYQTRADSRSSLRLPVPGRGRPDGEKRRWRRRRRISPPSGLVVAAADSGCDLPAACLRGIGTEPLEVRLARLLVRVVHLLPADLHRTRSRSRPCLGMHGRHLHSASPFVGSKRRLLAANGDAE